jgi:hypothetical protein
VLDSPSAVAVRNEADMSRQRTLPHVTDRYERTPPFSSLPSMICMVVAGMSFLLCSA